MLIKSAELRLLELPLKFRFQTSFGIQTSKEFALLILKGEGLTGVAECVSDALPLYREESNASAWETLERVFLPLVVGKRFANPEALALELFPFKGNPMAKATLEMAFWDLWARFLGQPLWKVLGGVRDAVDVGVSLGIQPSLEQTVENVAKHAEQGYKRIKLKIQPGWDVAPLRAVRSAFPDLTLTADANSSYTLADIRTLQAIDEVRLDYLEQPLAFDDLVDHAKLQAQMQTPLCLDESITSARLARQALELGACRLINIKAGRVGGHLESRRVHDVAQSFGAPLWCGGMLESGIGRAHNIHLATLNGFSKPGDTSSSSRYWQTDIIEEALEAKNGVMPVPVGNGIGVTLNMEFLERVTLKKISVGKV
jgi:o-succinylbenzoate synthase